MTTPAFVTISDGVRYDSDAPIVAGSDLIDALGTQPAVTIPLLPGDGPDIDALWRWLAEPAEFYGHMLPDHAQLRRAVAACARELQHGPAAMTVMAVLVAGQPQFVVTGTAIDLEPGRPVGLAIHAARPVEPLPHWQQMAARTSSRAAGRTLGRTLAASDHVDSVPMDGNLVGMPLLGALICETSSGRVALGADLPARMALGGMRVTAAPADGPIDIGMVVRAWWVSPHFRTHPVRAIGEHRL